MPFTHPDELHTAFAAAFQSGDIVALVDLYEDRAIQVQQDGTAVGRDELAEVFTRLLASGLPAQGEPQKAIVVGDLALTSTLYDFGPGQSCHRRGLAPSAGRNLASRHRCAGVRLNVHPRSATPWAIGHRRRR